MKHGGTQENIKTRYVVRRQGRNLRPRWMQWDTTRSKDRNVDRMLLGLMALIWRNSLRKRGSSFGHVMFEGKWRNTHASTWLLCMSCSPGGHAGIHFLPTNPVIKGCKKPRDLWHKESYCWQQWDFLSEICFPHLLLSYQFCRDVKWASASPCLLHLYSNKLLELHCPSVLPLGAHWWPAYRPTPFSSKGFVSHRVSFHDHLQLSEDDSPQ